MRKHSANAARSIFRRACEVHLPKKSSIHLAWAAFEETQGESLPVSTTSAPSFIIASLNVLFVFLFLRKHGGCDEDLRQTRQRRSGSRCDVTASHRRAKTSEERGSHSGVVPEVFNWDGNTGREEFLRHQIRPILKQGRLKPSRGHSYNNHNH